MDEREPSEEELMALIVTGTIVIAEGLALIRWLQRRVWLLRGICLINVTCAAWNATNVGHADVWWWVPPGGVLLNAWGAWKALRVERDFQVDIEKTRARLREVSQKMNAVERVRNESRA